MPPGALILDKVLKVAIPDIPRREDAESAVLLTFAAFITFADFRPE